MSNPDCTSKLSGKSVTTTAIIGISKSNECLMLEGTCSGKRMPILYFFSSRVSSVTYIATKMAVNIPTPPSATVDIFSSTCGAATSRKDISASIAVMNGSSL